MNQEQIEKVVEKLSKIYDLIKEIENELMAIGAEIK